DCNFIFGWGFDQTQPSRRVNIQLFDNDTPLTTVPANQFRQDLRDKGIGDGSGTYAFTLPMPAALKDGRSHLIKAKVENSDFQLSNSPQSFNSICSSSPSAAFVMTGDGKSATNNQTLTLSVSLGAKM